VRRVSRRRDNTRSKEQEPRRLTWDLKLAAIAALIGIPVAIFSLLDSGLGLWDRFTKEDEQSSRASEKPPQARKFPTRRPWSESMRESEPAQPAGVIARTAVTTCATRLTIGPYRR
jgi:hypothetical protein